MTGQNSLSLEPRPYSTTSTVIPSFEYLSIKVGFLPKYPAKRKPAPRPNTFT